MKLLLYFLFLLLPPQYRISGVTPCLIEYNISGNVNCQRVVYQDDFNRANSGDPGGVWLYGERTDTAGDELSIVSNQLQLFTQNGQGNAGVMFWPAANIVNQYASVTFVSGNGSDALGMSVRATAPGTSPNKDWGDFSGYWVMLGTGANAAKLVESNNDNLAAQPDCCIVHGTFTITNGQTVELRAIGSTISVHVNGSQVLSITDSTLASGQVGFVVRGSSGATYGTETTLVDNFVGGPL